jgi:predicted GIY-YIG superfamily endonuclease
MAIDECRYTFAQLAGDVLPRYMAELRRRIVQPTQMAEFAIEGVGIATLLRQFNIPKDFEGCYVLIDGARPIYVGISQTVFRRIRQHVRGTTHFDASLAYRIANAHCQHNMTRNAAMTDTEFKRHFSEAQAYLRGLNVASIEISNPLELYLFEAYCAMELDTSEWNTFETH